MSDIINQHKTEAANLALEYFDLLGRIEQIKGRMGELKVILATAERYESQQTEEVSP